MTATSAPFGLRPARHNSGQIRSEAVTIASAYASTIYKHAPVKMLSDGTIGLAVAGDAFVGVLLGVDYKDANGKPSVSPMWTANTVATDIVAYITRDPDIIYEIQATATLAQTNVGNLVDISNETTGVAGEIGTSTATANAATAGTASAQLQILGFAPGPDNVAGDAFPVLRVRIAEHQLSGWDSGGTYAADAGI